MAEKSELAQLLLKHAMNKWHESKLDHIYTPTELENLQKKLAGETGKKVEIEKVYPKLDQNRSYKFRLS